MWRRRCGWDAFVADEENEEKEGGEDERDQRIVGEDGGGAKQREGEGQGWMRKDESNEEESNECENGLRDRRETIENDLTETEEKVNYAEAGPNDQEKSGYEPGDYVLVRFPTKNVEYRCAAMINEINEEDNDLQVTFLKICDAKVQIFRINESDISDVTFD
ncbi:hypothetical protein PV328_001247 [Microctonus aethiopoides]|uniref:Uncharacterized protein n=1 Tax=Microctonus aethiopoides TaxID=144406 RepID=A0AA39FXR0_9HYME|nr:hypothetical protein PV328_001247 [Microctonus aethiopoides]